MKITVKTENTCRCCAVAVGAQDPAAVSQVIASGNPGSLCPQSRTLLLPGGPDGSGDPRTLAASVGCRWSSGSKRATWERLEVGLGVGQHLPARSSSSLSSLRLLSVNKLPSSFLGLFPHRRGSPSKGRSLSLQFFAYVLAIFLSRL